LKQTAALWALSAALAAGGCGADEAPRGVTGPEVFELPEAFDAERALGDLRAQVQIGPRPAGSPGSEREVELIVARLRAAGLDPLVQHPHLNVVATIGGEQPGTVVIGAHHDTKAGIPGFVGANDGASGVAVLLELARLLGGFVEAERRPLPGPTIALAFFDAEEARGERSFIEDGLRGSSQFVRLAEAGGAQGTPRLEQITAMYLLDLVGDCDLAIPREQYSDPRLYARLRGPVFGGETGPIADDHLPFLGAGIPAVDIIDFTYGPGPSPGAWWHTPRDTLDKVCGSSLRTVGNAVLLATLVGR
jgi:Zn-dependent M28 family amino/carboxypeptidase